MLAIRKLAKSTPARLTSAQPNSITPPVAIIGSTPMRAIRWPVKNEGRNMAMMCAWITVALSVNWKPQASMASGVADMVSVMTA